MIDPVDTLRDLSINVVILRLEGFVAKYAWLEGQYDSLIGGEDSIDDEAGEEGCC